MTFSAAFSWGRWLDSESRSGGRAGPGRRVHVRYVCNLLGMCKPAGSDAMQTLATLVNVSRGGVSLLVGEPFGKGAILSLKAPLAGGSFLVCVAHISVQPDGRRRLGCVFVEELTREALRGFWNREATEQRGCQRFLCEGLAWYRPLGNRRLRRRRAIVFDVSSLGAFLVSGQRIRAGSTLCVELDSRVGQPVRTLAYVVRTQALNNKKWTCGCTFVRQLGPPELNALRVRRLPER